MTTDGTERLEELTWEDFLIEDPQLASPADVAEAEQALGVKLPEDFVSVASVNQGRHPSPSRFRIADGSSSSISYLLHFAKTPMHTNIVARGGPVHFVLSDKVIPFAEDGGGNLLCFDYRTTPDHPSVAFWDHESEDKDQVQWVADSFTDLLGKLYAKPRPAR